MPVFMDIDLYLLSYHDVIVKMFCKICGARPVNH